MGLVHVKLTVDYGEYFKLTVDLYFDRSATPLYMAQSGVNLLAQQTWETIDHHYVTRLCIVHTSTFIKFSHYEQQIDLKLVGLYSSIIYCSYESLNEQNWILRT